VCTTCFNNRTVLFKKVKHYEVKNIKLKQATSFDTKSLERISRNIAKFNEACDKFEPVNKECYQMMRALVSDKQQYLNPIVTRFMKLNLIFFRKCNTIFQQECSSIDTEGHIHTAPLYKIPEGKDVHLHRLEVLREHDIKD
jgi:negative regulator of replication initiation